MATKPVTKIIAKEKAKEGTRLPPNADYSDEVTEKHSERIKSLVPEDDYKDAKSVSGPAW